MSPNNEGEEIRSYDLISFREKALNMALLPLK